MEHFGLQTFERDSWVVVAISGDVDLVGAAALRDCLRDLLTDGRLRIVVDLTGSEFLDSSGMGILAAGVKRLRAKAAEEGQLRVVATNRRVLRTFELSGLQRVFPIYATVEEACR